MHKTDDELRPRHPYVGTRRAVRRHGKLVKLGQRAFALPAGAIKWMVEDQHEAVERGYFVARVELDNHARIVPLHGYASDAEAMSEIEAACFHRDGHAAKLIAFVEQQDAYGYSGAWDASVARFTPALRWYKLRKAAERAASRALSKHGRTVAKRRWNDLT